ncbi:MAG: phosphatidylinositol mannoside acyltransferase [Actinomycetaceae bacterium]|nr:phosphatidylinositol mannoside acyltransferase [Actinomycetaceae bacterium]
MSRALVPLFNALGNVPAPLASKLGSAAGHVTGLLPTGSKAQLVKNHQRLSDAPLTDTHVSRAFAAYFQMFAETPSLHRWSEEQIRSAVDAEYHEELLKDLESGPVVVAMTHSGNWDLAGAWASFELAKVVTVAEVVKPPELYDFFVQTRQSLGMEILPAKRGIFKQLREQVEGRNVLVPLLADRDITGGGLEVDFGGHRALVAAGPAALAKELNRPLWVNHMSFSRLDKDAKGSRARAGKRTGESGSGSASSRPAGGRYTLHLRPVKTTGAVEADTQAWVDTVVPLIQSHLADWHMLQPLFVQDLDPDRLARARERHARHARDLESGSESGEV